MDAMPLPTMQRRRLRCVTALAALRAGLTATTTPNPLVVIRAALNRTGDPGRHPRRRIGDVGADWRALLLGAPPVQAC